MSHEQPAYKQLRRSQMKPSEDTYVHTPLQFSGIESLTVLLRSPKFNTKEYLHLMMNPSSKSVRAVLLPNAFYQSKIPGLRCPGLNL